MDRYDTRRQQLASVIYTLTEAVKAVIPTDQQANHQLELAEQFINQSTVSLAVVGAEGHGKSSLIDAIIGAVVAPREAQHPSTVAPVFILWHPETEIHYAVGLDDTGTPTPCVDVDQFRRFILQRFNPNNERNVRFGLAQCNNPLLADGLRLVDMPGLEGVSQAVSIELRKELADIEAVIVVIRDRLYGPAFRLIEEFTPQLKIQAIVCNWSLDFWIGKSDKALQSQIKQQKQIVLDELGNSEVKISPEQIFVLHVPSISDCELIPGSVTGCTPHIQEIERFRRWITQYLDEDRVTALLADTKNCIDAVILRLEQKLQTHRQLIIDLEAGDKKQRQQARKTLKRTHKAAIKQWRKLEKAPEIADSVKNSWTIIRNKLKVSRDSLLHAINHAQSTLPPSDQWNRKTVADLMNRLRPEFVKAEEELWQAQTDFTLELAKKFYETSVRLLAEAYESIPIIPGALDSLQISGDPLLEFTHPDPGPAAIFEFFSSSRIVKRILKEYRSQVEAIDITKNGVQAQIYHATVASTKQTFLDALEERFDHKHAVLEEGTVLQQRLPDEQKFLDAIDKAVAEVKAFTTAISA